MCGAILVACQQDVIDDFTERVAKAECINSLTDEAVDLFTLNGLNSAVKSCWPIYRKRADTFCPAAQDIMAVFDFPALFWAAYASPQNGDASSRIATIAEEINAKKIIVAHDSATSRRRDLWPAYKSGREEEPADFLSIRDDTVSLLKQQGYQVEVCEGWESDDIMASVAFRCKLRKQPCIIVTDDRDLLSMCGNGVMCYSPRNHNYVSEVTLFAKHSITPAQVVDWLCIAGKDEAPSVSGIGDTIALKLLQKYGDFWSILYHRENLQVPRISEKAKAALTEFGFGGKYFIAKEVHTLNRKMRVHW